MKVSIQIEDGDKSVEITTISKPAGNDVEVTSADGALAWTYSNANLADLGHQTLNAALAVMNP